MSRPRFWLYTAGPFLIGSILGVNHIQSLNNSTFFITLLFFLIPANIYVYGVNDLADTDTDAVNQKKDEYEVRLQKQQRTLVWILVIITICLAAVLPLQANWNTQASVALIIFLVVAGIYSLPPFRLKARPFLDFISNVHYVFPGIVGYALYTHTFPKWYIILAAGCWTGAMHLYSAIPDIASDKSVGVTTTAVWLSSYRVSLLFTTALWFATFAILLFTKSLLPFSWLLLVYPVLTFYLYFQPEPKTTQFYKYFPYLNAVLGFSLFWYIAITHHLV